MSPVKIIFSIQVLFIAVQSFAQNNVTVRGKAPGYEGKEIILEVFEDLITYSTQKESFDTVAKDGYFELRANIKNTQAVKISIGNNAGKIYLQPDFMYGIIFPHPDSVQIIHPHSENAVDIHVISDSTELNARIIDFNIEFDKFWSKNYKAFVAKRIHHELDTFYVYCKKRYEKVKDPYFSNYLEYTFALINNNTARHKVFMANKFLLGKPVLHYNFEYMDFFNQYFKFYLTEKCTAKKGTDLLTAINIEPNLGVINSILKDDPYLKNDTTRELLVLKGLNEMYYSPEYNQKNIIMLIEQINKQTTIKLNQTIATNMLRNYYFLQPGSRAPGFTVQDKTGNSVSLSAYLGKFVYLNFYDSRSVQSLQELKKIEQLKNKYADKVTFVSVSIDEKKEDFSKLLTLYPKFNWIFLYAGSNNAVSTTYHVKATPCFFFINRDGNLIQSPALRPSEGIELRFNEFFKVRKKGK